MARISQLVLAVVAISISSSITVGDQTSQFELEKFNLLDKELLKLLHRKERHNNWVVSGASLKSLLSVVLEGSNGTTFEELAYLLRLPKNKAEATHQTRLFQYYVKLAPSKVIVKNANAVAISNKLKFKSKFFQDAQTFYNIQLKDVDFSQRKGVANYVNNWVSQLTDGHLKELISEESISPDMLVMLLNAVYFNGKWLTSFDTRATRQGCFYSRPDHCTKTAMMELNAELNYHHDNFIKAQIVAIPYEDPRYSMILVVPEKKDKLSEVIQYLTDRPLTETFNKMERKSVTVVMPSFSLEYKTSLKNIIMQLGAHEIFSATADLTDMMTGSGRISDIFHSAKIDVNEAGTVASAGSAAFVVPLSLSSDPRVIADHPFVFFIHDSSTGILFLGQVVNPTSPTPVPQKGNGVSQKPVGPYPPPRPTRVKQRLPRPTVVNQVYPATVQASSASSYPLNGP